MINKTTKSTKHAFRRLVMASIALPLAFGALSAFATEDLRFDRGVPGSYPAQVSGGNTIWRIHDPLTADNITIGESSNYNEIYYYSDVRANSLHLGAREGGYSNSFYFVDAPNAAPDSKHTIEIGAIHVGSNAGSDGNYFYAGSADFDLLSQTIDIGSGTGATNNRIDAIGSLVFNQETGLPEVSYASLLVADTIRIGAGKDSSNSLLHADRTTAEIDTLLVGSGDGSSSSWANLGVAKINTVHIGSGANSFENDLTLGYHGNSNLDTHNGKTSEVGTIYVGMGGGSDNSFGVYGSTLIVDAVYFGDGANFIHGWPSGRIEVGELRLGLNTRIEGAPELAITEIFHVTISEFGHTQIAMPSFLHGAGSITFGEGMVLAFELDGMFELEEGRVFDIVTAGEGYFYNESLALQDGTTFIANGWEWQVFSTDGLGGTFSVQALQAIPEPSTWLLLGAGAALVIVLRRRTESVRSRIAE